MTRRTAAGGLLAIAAFMALAWVSAALSPLGRGPVLDGLGPLAPYRWVQPPPGVENEGPPQGGTFELAVDDAGSEPDVLFTPDDQITLVVDRGAIGPGGGREAVTIVVTPLDPATLATLPGDLQPFGNAARIEVGGVERFDGQVDVVLLYPETVTLHATRHDLLWSRDGADWQRLDTTDTPATQQAQATIEAPGLVVVGAVPVPHPSASASPPVAATGSSNGAVLVVVGAGVVALLAVAIVARRGRG